MKSIPEDILQDYLDGRLQASQRMDVESMPERDPELQERLRELREVDTLLRSLHPEQPSVSFTDKIMLKLESSTEEKPLPIRNGILLLAGMMILIVISAALLSAGVFAQPVTIDLPPAAQLSQYIRPIQSIPVDGELIMNVILFSNIVLAFFVLDRTILKPLFQRRLGAQG